MSAAPGGQVSRVDVAGDGPEARLLGLAVSLRDAAKAREGAVGVTLDCLAAVETLSVLGCVLDRHVASCLPGARTLHTYKSAMLVAHIATMLPDVLSWLLPERGAATPDRSVTIVLPQAVAVETGRELVPLVRWYMQRLAAECGR